MVELFLTLSLPLGFFNMLCLAAYMKCSVYSGSSIHPLRPSWNLQPSSRQVTPQPIVSSTSGHIIMHLFSSVDTHLFFPFLFFVELLCVPSTVLSTSHTSSHFSFSWQLCVVDAITHILQMREMRLCWAGLPMVTKTEIRTQFQLDSKVHDLNYWTISPYDIYILFINI